GGTSDAIRAKVLEAFDEGDHSELMRLWDKHVPMRLRRPAPGSDVSEGQLLEFFLEVHCAVMPFREDEMVKAGSAKRASMACARGMAIFKRYLDGTEELGQHPAVLPFYALPHIPSPPDHPQFSALFAETPNWVEERRNELSAFLSKVLSPDVAPMLCRLAEGGGYESFGSSEKAEWSAQVKLLEQRLRQVTRFTQATFTMCSDLMEVVELQGRTDRVLPEEHLQIARSKLAEYEKVLVDLVNRHGDTSWLPPARGPAPAAAANGTRAHQEPANRMSKSRRPILKRSQSNLILAPLDYKAIKSELRRLAELANGKKPESKAEAAGKTSGELNQEPSAFLIEEDLTESCDLNTAQRAATALQCAIILQALRWRFSRASPGKGRMGVLYQMVKHDLFEIRDDRHDGTHLTSKGQISLVELLLLGRGERTRENRVWRIIAEYTIRLMNSLATISKARSYLLGHDDLIPSLVSIVRNEGRDSVMQKSALGLLQKCSLRRRPQAVMIKCGILPWLAETLHAHTCGDATQGSNHLSDFTMEYATALLMNISLRPEGKVPIEEATPDLMQVISNLLESPNQMVRQYVNGALYSMLSRATMRERARSLGIDEVLQALRNNSSDVFRRQIEYILEQLRRTDDDDEGESKQEEGDDEEADLCQDEGTIPPDEMPEDAWLNDFVLTRKQLDGEDLLCKRYRRMNHPEEIYAEAGDEGEKSDEEELAMGHTLRRAAPRAPLGSSGPSASSRKTLLSTTGKPLCRPTTPQRVRSELPNSSEQLSPSQSSRVVLMDGEEKEFDVRGEAPEELQSRPRIPRTPTLKTRPGATASQTSLGFSLQEIHPTLSQKWNTKEKEEADYLEHSFEDLSEAEIKALDESAEAFASHER
ncbi:unnamed protein product, partial [Chrysoparadoxa australica]